MKRKSLGFIFFFILSISAPFSIKSIPITFSSAINDSTASTTTISSRPRRILHQPLFPVTSTPPPYSDPEPPPPPPPDSSSSSSSSSSLEPPPFFNEQPTGPTPDQSRPTPSLNSNGTMPIPAATPPSKPTKTVAVAISVVIVTLGMLSALAFFLYRHRSKHPAETEKLVGGGGGDSNSINNSQRFSEDPRVPPSSFLYIGTVEPSQSSVVEQSGVNATANSSPDRKLNSVKRSSDRYRPSPELQPLPPLPHPPVIDSPSEISSSEEEYEESHYTAFYTPQASSLVSYDDSFHSPASRLNNPVHSSYSVPARIDSHFNSNNNVPSVPHSKRTSPKSRLYVSTTKQTQPTPPPPPPPQATRLQPHQIQTTQSTISSSPPRRPKFSSPPPPPNLALLQSISNRSVGAPPPPPPPPPSLSIPGRVKPSDSNVSTMPRQFLSEPKFPVPTRPKADSISRSGTSNSVEAVENPNSEEKHDGEGERPRLKPLHWDKVRATSDRATVWDQLKSSSFQLNEDMMETLFCFNSANPAPKEVTRKSVLPPVEKENRVLDPKKSQNIAILLRALNVSREEVTESLLDGNPEGLGPELLETLVKMAPTKEEEIKLRDYHGDVSKLGSAERFLKAVLDIPFAFKRVEAMLYRANFDTELKYLRNCFESLEAASGELKNSRLFLALLEAVLRTGNRMNVGTNRGDAKAFKLDTLLKLVDIKGTDGKTTLLHFVVQEIIRSEGVGTNENNQIETQAKMKDDDFNKQGLQIVSGLSRDLVNVKKAAGMDSDVLSSYVSKLEIGLEKVSLILQYEKIPDGEGKFFNSMKLFLKEAEEEMTRIKADEKKALSLVKGVTEYFHGNAAKEEAHPFRIFMIVRDFLSILDQVCKEVGRMQGRTVVGSARSFRISSTASLPVLNRYNVRQARSSDEESSSSP